MISIRKACIEDCSSIATVHMAAVRAIGPGHYSTQELEAWQRPRKAEHYEQAIETKEFLVATEGELIVAFGVLNQETREIEALYTSPEVRGTGVGLNLLQEIERRARDMGLDTLHLNASLNAVGFYQKAGYVAQPQSTYRLANGFEIRCVPMSKLMNLTKLES